MDFLFFFGHCIYRDYMQSVKGEAMRTLQPNKKQPARITSHHSASTDEMSCALPLRADMHMNLRYLHAVFDRASDIVFREFKILDGRDAVIIYVSGLIDTKQVNSDILLPLKEQETLSSDDAHHISLGQLVNEHVAIAAIQSISTLKDAVKAIVEQIQVLLLIDEESMALAFGVDGRVDRAIEESSTESVIRGPHEGFIENINTNLSLIRRRIRTSDLKVESFEVGTYTKTKIALCYIDGIVNTNLVKEVQQRMYRIDTDAVIDSGYIEEFIEDDPYSPFPQIQNTERPDVIASSLLEGKVAILVDGSPFALTAPINLWSSLQAAEDYYERYMIATAIRFLRYMFMFMSLYFPALYVAITTFHQEMLPNRALLQISAAREVTPFPAVIEALIMEITFEALREAGIRLPKAVGSATSIVGALVIGQAAVQAGIISAPMVIVVSITGIASFVIPRYSFAIALRLLRFPMIILAGTLGLFGIIVATLIIVIHLSKLRSLGVPYLQPVSPFQRTGMKDVFMRAPHWSMKQRPWQTSKSNFYRQTDATTPKSRIPKRQ